MTPTAGLSLCALLIGALALPSGAQITDLGRIAFPNSGNAAAQEPFLRGALLLHSFEYDDAAEAFRAARSADPGFALAYWGEALTHSHPLWEEEDTDAAREILEQLAPTRAERLAAAPAGRERGLLECVEILFGEGERIERQRAYSEAMGRLHAQHPDDLEIQSFYALSILGTSAAGRDFRISMRAAGVAEEVYAKNPQHPGALHYLIHCYDDPVHAPLGLRLARRYDVVAPAAAHALHMPSHIYVALGMWEESAAANINSSAAADARVERKGLTLEDRGYHSLLWLLYTRLQQGREAEAEELLQDMVRDAEESGSRRTRYHLAMMRAAWLVDTRRWEGPAVDIDVDLTDLGLAAAAADLLVDGMAALGRGDTAAAQAARWDIRLRIEDRLAQVAGDEAKDPSTGRRPDADPAADVSIDDDEPALGCCAPDVATDPTSPPGRRAAYVMEQLLQGQILLHRGATDEALAVLARAAEAEDAMSYDFGPPVVVKPAHELLGEVLLDLGRAEDAVPEFQAALQRAPRRAYSLLGLSRAAAAAGDQALSRSTREELRHVWQGADPAVSALLAAAPAASRETP